MKKIMIVGAAGKQGFEYFNMIKEKYSVVALVDNDLDLLLKKYAGLTIPVFKTLEEAVAKTQADIAILAVPHAFHFPLTLLMLESGIHVIKEKPFALSLAEAETILSTAKRVGKSVFVITQRHSAKTFDLLQKNISLIGRPLYFNYEFFMKLPTQTSGWRARRDVSVGGVVLDMGYHAVDLLERLFGGPSNIQTNSSYRYDDMLKEGLEDSSMSVFKYKNVGLYGNLLLDRHSDKKHESLKIVGSIGRIEWGLHELRIEVEGKGEIINYVEDKNSAYVLKQLSHYIESVDNIEYFNEQAVVYISNTKTVEKMYNNAELIFLPKDQSVFRNMISRMFLNVNQLKPVINLYAIRS